MKNELILSQTLIRIKKQFLSGKDIAIILDKAIDLALLQEQELIVHRLCDAEKEAKEAMEREAGKMLQACILVEENNVVSLDFKRGEK